MALKCSAMFLGSGVEVGEGVVMVAEHRGTFTGNVGEIELVTAGLPFLPTMMYQLDITTICRRLKSFPHPVAT